MKTSAFLLFAAILVPGAACAVVAGPPTCPDGMKLVTYDQPKDGTKPLNGKHARCESLKVDCPWGMKAAWYDTEVPGSSPADGRFVRCEDGSLPSAGKRE